MKAENIKNLVQELLNKKVDYVDYEGKHSKMNLIWDKENSKQILEQIITQHILYNRDSRIAELESKVFMYEEIIKKSNFAPMVKHIVDK